MRKMRWAVRKVSERHFRERMRRIRRHDRLMAPLRAVRDDLECQLTRLLDPEERSAAHAKFLVLESKRLDELADIYGRRN